MVVEFRSDGSMHRQWQKNPSPHMSEWTTFYDYNDANQLVTVRVEQAGTVTTTQILEYDSEGRISRVIVPGKDGTQRVAEFYSYEPDGRKKKTLHIESHYTCEGGGCGPMFGVDGTDVAYGAPGATSVTSIYDHRAHPVEHLFHDDNGELVTRLDFRYDDRGNLVEEICALQKLSSEIMKEVSPDHLDAFRKIFTIRRSHRYDEHDRKIETSTTMAADDWNRDTFEYNEYGDVSLQTSESSHGQYDFEKGELRQKSDTIRSHRSETQFLYQYDLYGNWNEKIVQSPDGHVWSLERRTISYFDYHRPL